MGRRLPLTVVCGVAFGAPLAAQATRISLDASVGAHRAAQRAAVSVWYPVIHLAGRLTVGPGARVSWYAGDPIGYTNRGPVQGNLAAMVSIDPAIFALNGAVFGELHLTSSVALGANLDVIGVATGPTRTTGSLSGRPQGLSYLGYGSRDHGALNSEFYVSLRVAPRVRIRAGASHYVTNYTVTDTAAAGAPSSRYQKFETVPFIAVRLRF